MGEEAKQDLQNIDSVFGPDSISHDFIKPDFLQSHLAKREKFNKKMSELVYGGEILSAYDEVDCETSTVWIDPLDGTTDFVKGNLSAVTVLIGLAVNGVPKIGVVHNPFKTNENDGMGMTIFGTQEHGAFVLEYNAKMSKEELAARVPKYMEPFEQEKEISDDYEVRVAASLSHFN
mmetsp:Transcript_1965/g.3443  ORF Transcript_1965/g.3443 Transcript_1965/m.3443 type:complete len:176 (+) Transcript_1965:233-760(+)